MTSNTGWCDPCHCCTTPYIGGCHSGSTCDRIIDIPSVANSFCTVAITEYTRESINCSHYTSNSYFVINAACDNKLIKDIVSQVRQLPETTFNLGARNKILKCITEAQALAFKPINNSKNLSIQMPIEKEIEKEYDLIIAERSIMTRDEQIRGYKKQIEILKNELIEAASNNKLDTSDYINEYVLYDMNGILNDLKMSQKAFQKADIPTIS